MDDVPPSSRSVGPVSPIENPRKEFIRKDQKALIIDLFKTIIAEQPTLKTSEILQFISKKISIGLRAVQNTIYNYKRVRSVVSSDKKLKKLTCKQKISDFDRSALRRTVHSFWTKNMVPTGDNVLAVVNLDSTLGTFSKSVFYSLLKHLNFRFIKRSRYFALVEREDIVLWRGRYIEKIREFRSEGRPIYYLDETYVDAYDHYHTTGAANATGRVRGLIVIHIGSDDGFVDGGLSVIESKKRSAEYHEELNGDTFLNWLKGVVPLLKRNAVIVMDNAPCHSVELERNHTFSWKKAYIKNWLEHKGEQFHQPTNEVGFCVDSFKYNNKLYVVDEYVKSKNMTMLRLPPYHCELNPIELSWSSVRRFVKANVPMSNPPDVRKLIADGVKQCSPEMWQNFIKRVIEEENRLWDVDFAVKDYMVNSRRGPIMFTDKSGLLTASNGD